MAEYIDRERLKEVFYRNVVSAGVFNDIINAQPTADVVEREKIDSAIEEMKSLADPKNTILGFDEKMGLKTAMSILVRNIGE